MRPVQPAPRGGFLGGFLGAGFETIRGGRVERGGFRLVAKCSIEDSIGYRLKMAMPLRLAIGGPTLGSKRPRRRRRRS